VQAPHRRHRSGPDGNAKNVVWQMPGWLVNDQQLSPREDYTLCGVAGDLKISETLDLPTWLASMTSDAGSSHDQE
jgi:acetamidase/formamidase